MYVPASLRNTANRRSYLGEKYELRITGRCLEEDLRASRDTPFDDLLGQDIIKGFTNKRGSSPLGEEFTGHGTGQALYKLRYGDFRGATWHDDVEDVIWLLAAGRHRSGSPDDVYPYMEQLGKDARLLPDEEDYEALFDDRAERAAEVVPEEAAELLTAAREQPGTERNGVLGGQARVSVVVEVVDGVEEVCIAFSMTAVPAEWVVLIPAWFVPTSRYEEWMDTASFPTRPLQTDEICLRWVGE